MTRPLVYDGPDRRVRAVPVDVDRRVKTADEREYEQLTVQDRRYNARLRIMTGMLASLILLAGYLALTDASPEPFDPFTYDVVWKVTDLEGDIPELKGWERPSVMASDEIRVTGLRCNAEVEGTPARATVWWDRVDRGDTGRINIADDIEVVIEAGCEPISFELPVPNEIQVDLLNDPVGAQRWKIVGTSRPVAEGGVAAVWESEPIWIVGASAVNPHAEDE